MNVRAMQRRMRSRLRIVASGAFFTLLLTGAFAADVPRVELQGPAGPKESQPREMQEDTRKSIAHAYERAWGVLERALAENRSSLLDSAFTGAAREQIAKWIEQQVQSGLRQRYVDRGHKVDVLFYSPEGLSVQLRDQAHLELELLDGETVIYREPVTMTYVALLTPTEVTWKVRVLNAVPQ